MKKKFLILTIISCLVSVLLLSGCNINNSDKSKIRENKIIKNSEDLTKNEEDTSTESSVIKNTDLSISNKIAFMSNRSGNYEIYSMEINGNNQKKKITSTNSDKNVIYGGEAPDWSPDGTKIVFIATCGGNSEICIMNSDGSNIIRLTNNNEDNEYPAWSPDGTKIAFSSDRDRNADIYIMNSDGSNLVRLTNNKFDDEYPSWSPAGK